MFFEAEARDIFKRSPLRVDHRRERKFISLDSPDGVDIGDGNNNNGLAVVTGFRAIATRRSTTTCEYSSSRPRRSLLTRNLSH